MEQILVNINTIMCAEIIFVDWIQIGILWSLKH